MLDLLLGPNPVGKTLKSEPTFSSLFDSAKPRGASETLIPCILAPWAPLPPLGFPSLSSPTGYSQVPAGPWLSLGQTSIL